MVILVRTEKYFHLLSKEIVKMQQHSEFKFCFVLDTLCTKSKSVFWRTLALSRRSTMI